jgi:hypothetical protein
MENSKLLRRALWANVIFAELGAIAAFFFSTRWTAVYELTSGKGTLFGIDLLLFSGVAFYAVMKQKPSRALIGIITGLNIIFLGYLVTRLIDSASLSAAGFELIVITALEELVLIVCQIVVLIGYNRERKVVLPSDMGI